MLKRKVSYLITVALLSLELTAFKGKDTIKNDNIISLEQEDNNETVMLNSDGVKFDDMEIYIINDRIPKPIFPEKNKCKRAKYLADFYRATNARSKEGDYYSASYMNNIMDIMNGDYQTDNAEDVSCALVSLDNYLYTMPNSEWYNEKLSRIVREDELITSPNYNLDLTDVFLNNDDVKAFELIDYLDAEHKYIMASTDRAILLERCYNFYNCLASIYYGEGFCINGTYYTIDDIKGLENLGGESILIQCIIDVKDIALDIGVWDISYINKEGKSSIVNIDTINNDFLHGDFETHWKQNLIDSMVNKRF